MKPTYEQMAAALRIAEKAIWDAGPELHWSRYNHKTSKHDLEVPAPSLNMNDLWMWGCADAETIDWEHVGLFLNGLEELGARSPRRDWTKVATPEYIAARDAWCQERSFFEVAYVSVKRGAGDPENWFDHFRRDSFTYKKIDADSRARWAAAVAWWQTAIRALSPSAREDEATR